LLWIGWFGITLVVLVRAVTVISAGAGPYALLAPVAALPWAAPAFVAFVLIAAFGSMLAQLKAIRASTERQADNLQGLYDRKPLV
jgi:hypothetical protein